MNKVTLLKDIKKLGLLKGHVLESSIGDIYMITLSEGESKEGVDQTTVVHKSFSKSVLDPYLEKGDMKLVEYKTEKEEEPELKEEPDMEPEEREQEKALHGISKEKEDSAPKVVKYVYVPMLGPTYLTRDRMINDLFW